jgi:hypothetical protein
MATMVVDTYVATLRLGLPRSTVERGTIESSGCHYTRRWSWPCGCSGEIIAGSLIEICYCERHK